MYFMESDRLIRLGFRDPSDGRGRRREPAGETDIQGNVGQGGDELARSALCISPC